MSGDVGRYVEIKGRRVAHLPQLELGLGLGGGLGLGLGIG